jgi:hypothetical protein
MAQTGGEGRGRGNRLVGLPGQARTMPLRLPPIPHAGVGIGGSFQMSDVQHTR